MPYAALGSLAGSALNAGLQAISNTSANQNQWDINYFNYNAQKEFAQNSIQWKTQDAKNAGIHPLYALGNNASSYTPSSYIPSDRAPQVDVAGAMSLLGQEAQTDLLKSQKSYYDALAKEIRDRSKAMSGQNSEQMSGLTTGAPINGLGFAKKKDFNDKHAVVTKSAEDFSSIQKHFYDDNVTVLPRGLDTAQSIKQFFEEYSQDPNINIPGKIDMWFNSLSPYQREKFVVDILKSAGPTLELVDGSNYWNTTSALDKALRFNLFLDDIIPFAKYLWPGFTSPSRKKGK